MKPRGAHVSAAELRRAFDESFARPLTIAPDEAEELLAIRVGSAPYALRAREIAALMRTPRLTWLPSPAPELLGLTARRGALVAVYDLAALVGESASEAERGFCVVCRSPTTMAVCFGAFEGYFRVPRAAFLDAPADGPHAVRELALVDGVRRAVLVLDLVFRDRG